MNDIFIIIPTLNPNTKLLESFLEELQKGFSNILLFDDGCRKEYYDFFSECERKGIIVLHHNINLGKGRALKDSFNYLLEEYPNIKGVVTADSDGQHSIKDIKTCAKLVLDNPKSLILGCRNFDLENVPNRNRFGNKTTRAMFRIFVGLNISDTQTGLRGLSKDVMISFMDTKGERFEYETNQLIDSKFKNITIKEFLIDTIYLENSNSESHFNPITDSIAIYKTFIKYIISSFSSALIDILIFAILNYSWGNSHIIIETIVARIISSIYNYIINSKVVFNSKSKFAYLKYALLVIIQMLASACTTNFLKKIWYLDTVWIKIIVDVIIFIINFIIQREFIFNKMNN